MCEFRFDSEAQQEGGGGVENNFWILKDTHLEADKEKERLYELYKENDISQIWYFLRDLDEHIKSECTAILQNGIDNIIRFLYGFDEDFEMKHDEMQLTYYNKNCRFGYHLDAEAGYEDGPVCAAIIYLNENYDRDNGGLLVLNDNEIVPELGTIAVMDLNNHAIWHGITEVTGDLGRYAIFTFPFPVT